MTDRLVDLGIVLILLLGITLFQAVRSARFGNFTAALALLCALTVIVSRYSLSPLSVLLFFAAIGTVSGGVLALRVSMVGIPGMVALQNGLGGMASFLVSFVELTRGANPTGAQSGDIAALLGITIGAATFSGSLIAAGRLSRWLAQTPVVLSRHGRILAGVAMIALLLMVTAVWTSNPATLRLLGLALIGVAGMLGVILSLRIGGADMPVLISFLNAGSGVAAAFCGLSIGNWLLIAAGAMVGVSGMILTQVMCQAMNRSLPAVLTGLSLPALSAVPLQNSSPLRAQADPVIEPAPPAEVADPFTRALDIIRSAQRIIVVPGYGMALADAQQEISSLADKLTTMGKEVVFAIHPVAGRMPGHMHVLLAEAEVDYGMIRELADVNAEFAQTDLALVVGACDVVNPAAIESTNTPISGMPILKVHEARNVVVCNLDERPGYSGVENPLYHDPRTIMLLGDAKDTVGRLLAGMNQTPSV